jgi:cobalt/nickel transport protein
MAEDMNNVSKKTTGLWVFFGVAMLVAILLAVFISPWASSSPDGLEKVAEDKGFLEAAEETEPTWKHSPIPDYGDAVGTKAAVGMSGLMGVLITAAVAIGVALLALGLGIITKKRAAEPDRK